MTVTISGKNFASISTCESITGWTGNKIALVPDYFKEGSNSVGFTLTAVGNNDAYFTGSWDLSSTPHLRMWLMTTVLKELESDINGGIQLWATGGGNTGYWKISGKDSYPGGWYNLVVNLARPVDSGVQPTLSSVTALGLRLVLTAAPKNAQNTWIDNLICCDGLIAKGDDGGGYFDLDDIYALDNDPVTGGFGIIRRIGYQYFATGTIEIGNSAADTATKFNPKSQVLVFEDRKVNTSLYGLSAVDYGGVNATEFILGSKAGGCGIEGCIIRVAYLAQAAKFSIVGNNANVDNFKLYGSIIYGASSILSPANALTVEMLNCNFESCGEVIPQDSVVEGCNFINAPGNACRIAMVAHRVKNCNFISCIYCTHVNISEEIDFDGLKFSGSDGSSKYDINHSVAGILTVNLKNGSNAQYVYEGAGGSTNLVSPVTLTLTGLPDNTEVSIVKVSDRTVLYHVENTSGNVVYNYGASEIGLVVDILSVHLDYDPNLSQIFDYTLGSANATIPISLVSDPTYYNP